MTHWYLLYLGLGFLSMDKSKLVGLSLFGIVSAVLVVASLPITVGFCQAPQPVCLVRLGFIYSYPGFVIVGLLLAWIFKRYPYIVIASLLLPIIPVVILIWDTV